MTDEATGDCYVVAGRIVALDDSKIKDELRLCHGRAFGRGLISGQLFDHAWVEVGGTHVIDQSNGLDVFMRREHYYEIGQIKEEEVKRYTQKEALEWMLKTGHYGPWEDDVPENAEADTIAAQ